MRTICFPVPRRQPPGRAGWKLATDAAFTRISTRAVFSAQPSQRQTAMKQMKLRISLGVATVTLLGSLESATAQGNLVVNGEFDISATGWIMTDVGINGGWYGKGDPGGAFRLDATPSPSLYPTISQTIDGLVPGGTYTISGNYVFSAPYGDVDATDPSFGVSIGGLYVFETAEPALPVWQSFCVPFTATDSTEVLSLSSQLNDTHLSYIVDNITVEAVPEPNSLSLIGVGGIAGLLWLRRKGSAC